MNALESVQLLKTQAIDLLLNEREQIDQELNQLGYGKEKAPGKKRGRPSKQLSTSVQPCTTGSTDPSTN